MYIHNLPASPAGHSLGQIVEQAFNLMPPRAEMNKIPVLYLVDNLRPNTLSMVKDVTARSAGRLVINSWDIQTSIALSDGTHP